MIKNMDYSESQLEKIEQHSSNISSIFGDCFLELAGSMGKETSISGSSDVDGLLMIPNSFLNDSPNNALDYVHDTLKMKLPNTTITKGSMAVTIHYCDIDYQVLPVVDGGFGTIHLSNGKGGWTDKVDYGAFRKQLNDTCHLFKGDKYGNKAINAIRVVKYLLREKMGDDAPTGYHIESMCEEALSRLPNRQRQCSSYNLSLYCMEYLSRRILFKTIDVTGQSKYIDQSLGPNNSKERVYLSNKIGHIVSNIKKNGIEYEFGKRRRSNGR